MKLKINGVSRKILSFLMVTGIFLVSSNNLNAAEINQSNSQSNIKTYQQNYSLSSKEMAEITQQEIKKLKKVKNIIKQNQNIEKEIKEKLLKGIKNINRLLYIYSVLINDKNIPASVKKTTNFYYLFGLKMIIERIKDFQNYPELIQIDNNLNTYFKQFETKDVENMMKQFEKDIKNEKYKKILSKKIKEIADLLYEKDLLNFLEKLYVKNMDPEKLAKEIIEQYKKNESLIVNKIEEVHFL